ncbi:MAG: hypothetical protein H6738_12385 [Alphaproteobacteria bacterium]|nr:hypothetical protein [Alphaproteobacteria bacterium]
MVRHVSDLDFLDDAEALSEEEVIAPTPVRVARLRKAPTRSGSTWAWAALLVAGVASMGAAAGLAVITIAGLISLT